MEGGGPSACQLGVVVLAGETLARLTNGYFRPTFHEVVGGSAGPLLITLMPHMCVALSYT